MSPQVKDSWVRSISTHGNVRGVALQATELVKYLAQIHQLQGTPAKCLGEAVMAGLLVASYCRKGEKVNLNIQTEGRYKQALIDAYPDGRARGFLIQKEDAVPIATKELGPWETGSLSILRTADKDGKKPYIGTVPLLTGYLAKDLSFYWVQSEQIPSAVGLAVQMEDGHPVKAGGFLVQAMPGATNQEIRTIEKHILEMENLIEVLSKVQSPTEMISQVFQSTPFVVVEEQPIQFECQCSWERVEKALLLVGVQELGEMLKKNEDVIVHCDFCTREFRINQKRLEELIEAVNQVRS